MHDRFNANDWLVAGAMCDSQSAARDPRLAEPQAIEGVFRRHFQSVPTRYGALSEVLRSEWLGANTAVDQVFVSILRAGAITAWHAHDKVTDRIFVADGEALLVLYDNRPQSPTRGVVQEFSLSSARQALVIVPPRVWHGIRNTGGGSACLLNAVDVAYCYEAPDHWRVDADSDSIPYRFKT